MSENIIIALPKVRLLFPNLFEKTPIDGKFVKTEKERRYSAVFLLNKQDHADVIDRIDKARTILMEGSKLKKLPYAVMSCCDDELDRIYDGDEEGAAKKAKLAYMAGHYKLQAKTFLHPILQQTRGVNLNVLEDSNPFYAGCYVNGVIELAILHNKFGKGISKYLKYVGFAKDGEKLARAVKEIDIDGYFNDEDEVPFDDKDIF